MRVRFWGTRGSIAKPGPATLRAGGNTSCIEVRSDDGTLVVIDCGTGAHEFARHLLASGDAPARGHLLVSHTHWDHIQGFPFFDPLFARGSTWDIYAPGGRPHHLQSALAGQMSYDYHPVTLAAMEGVLRFHDLTEGVFDAGGVRVTTQYLNHPALTLGYRLEADGAVVVYASDHEPHALQGSPGELPVHVEDRRHVRFLADADLVIHDAQYVLDEFPEKAGWGHTPVERAVDYAIAGRVGRLALHHHDPLRDDDDVDRIEALGRRRAAARPLEVFAAREGREIQLSGAPVGHVATRLPVSALLSEQPPRASTVLLVSPRDEVLSFLRDALEPERMRIVQAREADDARRIARAERPALLLVDFGLPGDDELRLCRSLREDADPHFKDVPILLLTDFRSEADDVAGAFRAGASDYLVLPAKPTLLRSRVRSWLLRKRVD